MIDNWLQAIKSACKKQQWFETLRVLMRALVCGMWVLEIFGTQYLTRTGKRMLKWCKEVEGKMDSWVNRVRYLHHVLLRRMVAVVLSLCLIMPAWPAMPALADITPSDTLNLRISWETTNPTLSTADKNNCEDSYIRLDGIKKFYFNHDTLTNKGRILAANASLPISDLEYTTYLVCYTALGSTRTIGGTIRIEIENKVTNQYEEIYRWETGDLKGAKKGNSVESAHFKISDVWKPIPSIGNGSNFISTSMAKNQTYGLSSFVTASGYVWNRLKMGDVNVQQLRIVTKESTPTNINNKTLRDVSVSGDKVVVGANPEEGVEFRVAVDLVSQKHNISNTVVSDIIKIKTPNEDTPQAPTVSTISSRWLSVDGVSGQKYLCKNSSTPPNLSDSGWITLPTNKRITDLTPDTDYYIWTYKLGGVSSFDSDISQPLKVRTKSELSDISLSLPEPVLNKILAGKSDVILPAGVAYQVLNVTWFQVVSSAGGDIQISSGGAADSARSGYRAEIKLEMPKGEINVFAESTTATVNGEKAQVREVSDTSCKVVYEYTRLPYFDENDATFLSPEASEVSLKATNVSEKSYKIYSVSEGGTALDDPVVSAGSGKIILTFTKKPTEKTIYYITAREQNMGESVREKITVSPYTAPVVVLGSDMEVAVSFHPTDPDETIRTDTIDIATKLGSNPSVTFQASDFSVSNSESENIAIDGVTVTAIGSTEPGDTTLTVQIAKGVTAETGYLYYGDILVGAITISKTASTNQPVFTTDGSTYAKTAENDNEATFTLKEAGEAKTTYQVYATETSEEPLTNMSASVTGTTLKLTGISGLTEETTYYISATAQNKPESLRTAVTVTPYVAPSVTLTEHEGSVVDNTVEVTFAQADADTAVQSDTIAVDLNQGSNSKYEFSKTDFSISSSDSGKTPIAGISIKEIGEDTLTVEMAKSVTAETGYLYFGNTLVGEISISKTISSGTGTDKSSEKQITGFTISGQVGQSEINQTAHTIKVTMPNETNVTSLTPAITVSSKATVSPESGSAQDFTNPVTYTVTAEDGTTQNYQVSVEVQPPSVTKYTVTYDLTNIAANGQPTKVEAGKKLEATIAADSGYTLPERITVKMGTQTLGGSDYTYNRSTGTITIREVTGNVTITALGVQEVQKSSAKQITGFTISDQVGNSTINEQQHTIEVTMPYGTDLTSLSPTVTISAKASVSPVSGAAQNFSGSVVYTVTAEDGNEQEYTVTVTCEDAPTEYDVTYDLTNITANNQPGKVELGEKLEVTLTAKSGYTLPESITVEMGGNTLEGTDYTYDKSTGKVVISDVTGAVTITASGVSNTQASSDATLSELRYQIGQEAATAVEGFSADTVNYNVELPYGISKTEKITLEGTVNDSKASITANEGVTLSEGTGTATITVAAEDGTIKTYTVNFTIASAPADFVPVTEITGIPKTAAVGKPLEIKGTVKPSSATNQNITWEITDDGDTGAYFDLENRLVAGAAGKIILTATIEDGTAEGENYTQKFTITVAPTASTSDAEYVEEAADAVREKNYKISQSAAEDEGNFLDELVKLINQILEKRFGDDMERIEKGDIRNLETTADPVAGDEENRDGEDGSFSFDIEIHKGEESTVVEGLTGTITATPYTDEEQQEKDQEAVDEAIAAIEDAEYRIPQKSALTKEKLEHALKAKLKKKAGNATVSGVQFVGDIEFAVAGTKDNQAGTDGTFTFKASVSKGSIEDQWTDGLEGTIVAEEYVLKSPQITTTSLPDGTSGKEYNAQLQAESDTDVIWTVSKDSLPEGIELAEEGSLSGIPTEIGKFIFTVNAENGSNQGASEKELSITINAPSDQETYTITATAGTGGTISPSGEVSVSNGGKQTFTITPENRYYTSDVLVDGVSVGRQTTYTFENVTGNHTIAAVFERGSVGPSGGSSGGGSGSGGGSSNTTSTGNKATTTTNTTTTESGGQVTTSQTTDPTTGQTVTTTVEKDPEGNVIGANASVPAAGTTASVEDGKAQINAEVNGSLVSQAVGAAETAVPVNVTVDLPKQEVLAQLDNAAVADVHVDLTIPSQVEAGKKAAVTGITLDPEVVVAAKASGKDLTVTVKDEKGNLAYEWQIDGAALQGSTQAAAGMNLAVQVKPVQSLTGADEDVKTAAGGNGLYVGICHDGALPATVRVKVASKDGSGLQPGAEVSLYRYNPSTKQLEAADNSRYPVAADGTVTFPVGQGGEYVLLPAAAIPPAGTGIIHTVKKGEYPYLIAKQYGCSVEELLAANHIADVNNLQVGQQLVIPGR